MATKTDAQLKIETQQIANETVAGANTAARVGGAMSDIVDSKINIARIKGEYANNTTALSNGLQVGDIYSLPIVNDSYHLAIVKGSVVNNLDITSSGWGGITDQSTFESALTSFGVTGLIVSNFSLVGGRLKAIVNFDTYLGDFNFFTSKNITDVVSIDLNVISLSLNGNYISVFNPSLPSGLINLELFGNQIVTFDTIILPSTLQSLNLAANQIVTFNPTIALPSGLKTLNLGGNQIVTFNPTIALPSGLTVLGLGGNQIVTFNPSIALPNTIYTLNLSGNKIVTFNPSIALPSGLYELNLAINQIVTFDPSIALPVGIKRLGLERNQIVTFNPTIPLSSGMTTLILYSNVMSVSSVNTVLQYWDGLSKSSPFYLNLETQVPTASPSGGGITAKSNLQGRGCNVITD